MNVKHIPLYKRTSKGKIEQWQIEIHEDGSQFRTIHGLFGGKMIESGWTQCIGKNIGKVSETTPEQQALLEIDALYKKKLAQGKYTPEITEVDNAKASYISPMLAETFDPAKVTFPVSMQYKYDGVRAILTKDGLFSRKGKPFPVCKHILEDVKPLFDENPNLILDGEIYNHYYHNKFEELISIIKQQKPTEEDFAKAKAVLQFYVYDIPSFKGGFEVRYEEYMRLLHNDNLEPIFPYLHACSKVIVENEEDIADWFQICLRNKYEGGIVKLHGSPYENKRTWAIQKVKEFFEKEFDIADLEEGKGNWRGCAKRAILWKPGADRSLGIIRGRAKEEENTCFAAGMKGDKTYAKALLERKESVIGKPATLVYFRLTKYGVPYLPVLKVIRDYE